MGPAPSPHCSASPQAGERGGEQGGPPFPDLLASPRLALPSCRLTCTVASEVSTLKPRASGFSPKGWMWQHHRADRLCSCSWPGGGADESRCTPQSPSLWPRAPRAQVCRATGGRLRCRTMSCRHAAKWQHRPFPAGAVLAALSGPTRKQSLSPVASLPSYAASLVPAPPAQCLSRCTLFLGAGGHEATALPVLWLAGGLQLQLETGLVPWVPLTWAQFDPNPAWRTSALCLGSSCKGMSPQHPSALARWPGRTRAQQGRRVRRGGRRGHFSLATQEGTML